MTAAHAAAMMPSMVPPHALPSDELASPTHASAPPVTRGDGTQSLTRGDPDPPEPALEGGLWPPRGGARGVAIRLLRMAAVAAPIAFLLMTKYQVCVFARVTHLPCPGCGMTRATLALLDGRLLDAIAFHPLSPVISPLLAAMLIQKGGMYLVIGRWWETNQRRGQWGTRITLALVTLSIAVWAARFFGAFGGPVPV
jgi:hypothetical protein